MDRMSREISFYTDCLIIETILKDEKLIKQADAGSLVSSLAEKIKEVVGNHIDPNDKVGSLVNILGPGAISLFMKSLGMPKIGLLLGLAASVFHFDLNGIIKSIWDQLKSAVSGDKKIPSSKIDSVVQSAMQEHVKPLTNDDAADILETKSYNQLMRDARLTKLAMIDYQNSISKYGRPRYDPSILERLMGRQTQTANVLTRILSFIFKIAFSAAGLLIAGDVINKFLGRPNALDNTLQKGKPVTEAPAQTFTAKQTKFPVKPGYTQERYNAGNSLWTEQVQNNESSIEQMLIDFAKEVYSGLDGKEDVIRNSPPFHILKDRIVWYNHTSPNAPTIWIPKMFTSKKQMVDYFIDDVAEKSS